MFAVGAVSGTVLSFELGLLWPKFMGWAGSIIGMPFSLEGFAFFTEAIFLGIYLYAWNKVKPAMHILSGLFVAISGALSGIFVVIANAWMNTPRGFRVVDGIPVDIDPIQAMLNPSAFPQALHMLIASYAATAFAVAGIHAFLLLKDKNNLFHQRALSIAIGLAAVTGLLEPVSGHLLAKVVAENQPVKLAAMEGQFRTEHYAPLRIGGIPDPVTRTTPFALEIPGGLSFLAYDNFAAEVRGLDSFPRKDWPPVTLVHIAFQIMVACGSLMVLISLWTLWLFWQRLPFHESPFYLKLLAVGAPLGFIAVESGWMVTELGRQPWVIYGILRTADAVTPVPYLVIPFITFTLLYLFLGAIVIWLLRRQVIESPQLFVPQKSKGAQEGEG